MFIECVLVLEGDEVCDVLAGRYLPDEPLPETAPVVLDGDVAREQLATAQRGPRREWPLSAMEPIWRRAVERAFEDDEAVFYAAEWR